MKVRNIFLHATKISEASTLIASHEIGFKDIDEAIKDFTFHLKKYFKRELGPEETCLCCGHLKLSMTLVDAFKCLLNPLQSAVVNDFNKHLEKHCRWSLSPAGLISGAVGYCAYDEYLESLEESCSLINRSGESDRFILGSFIDNVSRLVESLETLETELGSDGKSSVPDMVKKFIKRVQKSKRVQLKLNPAIPYVSLIDGKELDGE